MINFKNVKVSLFFLYLTVFCVFSDMQVYFFPLLSKDFRELDGCRKRQLLKDSAPSSLTGGQTNGVAPLWPSTVLPCHSLTRTRIVEQLATSHNLARMLADYRASGGRIQQRGPIDPFGSAGHAAAGCGQSRGVDMTLKPRLKADSEDEKTSKQKDLGLTPKVSRVRLLEWSTGEKLHFRTLKMMF